MDNNLEINQFDNKMNILSIENDDQSKQSSKMN